MPNDRIPVMIEKLVHGGRGLARQGAEVLFVRGVIPGETVSLLGEVQHKGFREATVKEVLVASPDRVTAPCPVYEACGGCQLQHLRYDAQLVQKREMLRETLARVGKLRIETIPPVVPSPNSYGYRSTIRFVVFRERSAFALGFYKQGTHHPVAASCCLLVPEAVREVVAETNARLAARRRLPVRVESVEIRHSVAFGSILLLFRTEAQSVDQALELVALFTGMSHVVGQVVASRSGKRWVHGQDWIADRLDELIFRIGARSFMQANWILNERLSQTVADWVRPSPGLRILELYAGIGSLGLPLARRGALVTEVEANPAALADARHAAKTNHIGRVRFRPVRAEEMLETVQAGEYDLVLVDPPRTGVSRECLAGLLQAKIPKLLYLSCDAPTLARDLGRLCGAGYRVARIQPFDMFPQTGHLETLVELTR